MKLAGTRTKYRYSFPPKPPGQLFQEFTREPRTVVFGSIAHFPSRSADFTAPPAPMRGRHREVQPGDDEGQTCFRQHDGKLCQGVIEYLPPSDGCCGCSTSPMPPCGWCVSTMPECPTCGWRDEE